MTKISRKLNTFLAALLILACLFSAASMPEKAYGAYSGGEGRTVVIGYYDDDYPEFMDGFSDSTRKSGYAYEYMQEVARLTGWKYEYVYGDGRTIYDMLLEGSVDMIAGVSQGNEIFSSLLFPDYAMISQTYGIYSFEDNNRFIPGDIDSLNGKTVAVTKDSVQKEYLEKLIKDNSLKCVVFPLDDEKKCIEALKTRLVDGYVSSNIHPHEGTRMYFGLNTIDSYLALAAGREELLTELNSALSAMYTHMPYYNSYLEEKYFQGYSAITSLNNDEKKWLTEHEYLTIGITDGDLPFSALDEDGNVIGVISDILDDIETYLNIPVKVCAFSSSAMVENAVLNGEVDFAFPIYRDLWYAENNGYLLTNTLFSERAILVYKGEYSPEKLNSLAMGITSVSQRFLVDMYFSDSEVKVYSSRKEYMDAVLNGDVGCTVGSSSVITRFLKLYPEYSSLKTALLGIENEYCFAVSRDQHELVTILNKAIRCIEESTITDSMIRYSVVEKKTTFRDFVRENLMTVILFAIVVFLVLSITAIIIWTRFVTHRQTIKQQGDKLNETQANLDEAQASLEEALANELKAKTNLARALSDQNVIYSELLRLESGGIVAVDWETRKIVTINDAATKIYGFSDEESAIGKDAEILTKNIPAEFKKAQDEKFFSDIADVGRSTFEIPIMVGDRLKYYLQQAVIRVLANEQKVCLISLTDITESKELELELQTASRIDALSGVFNRGWGERRIDEMMAEGKGGMFCLLDINKFKSINDTYGHQTGDKAIKMVAACLKDSFRDGDIVMRLGGDEFAVYALGVKSREEGAAVINRFFARLGKARITEMGDRKVQVALGACICNDNDVLSFDNMYRMADSQMYKCKSQPESSFIFF